MFRSLKRFVEKINVPAHYDSVNLLPKKFVDKMVRIKFGKILGIRLYMTSALKIRFNDTILNKLLQNLM
jgi:hypothetical protein